MASFLNPHRPPVFCPGCSHQQSLRALDQALQDAGLKPEDVVIVSDIGCSGLFDTFFNTHAFHGLHGRALTYGAGIKMAQPHLKVIVTMGDGGLGIGGAHLLAACRRNLDLTLLILNNFNFGMTGGQFSCTTPSEALVGSSFLNTLEIPMDACTVAAASGAPFVVRRSVYQKDLALKLEEALSFEGFSFVDIWGFCPGRYLKKNPLSPSELEACMGDLPPFDGLVQNNVRQEYGSRYREQCGNEAPDLDWQGIEAIFVPPVKDRRDVLLLGSAGERVLSTGTVLATAAIQANMHATQKNEYDITVMRGPSVAELIISPDPIAYTGIEEPDVIMALSSEGVTRRQSLFGRMKREGLVIRDKAVTIPSTHAQDMQVDFKGLGIKKTDKALAALVFLAKTEKVITLEMLRSAIERTYQGDAQTASLELMKRTLKLPLEEPVRTKKGSHHL
jgi:Pyruvate/2-oxoacid:ferredoxin oxidoreductase gamma subunit